MFVTDRLVYLQLQKTGCSHIARLLEACVGGTQIGKHNRLDGKYPDRYVLGSIRNPWDWYVSLWAFGCEGRGGFFDSVTSRRHIRRFLKNPGKMFRDKKFLLYVLHDTVKPAQPWRAAYSNPNPKQSFKDWLFLVFERKYDFGEDYAFSPISHFAGFLTYRYMKLYSRSLSDIYRIRTLRHVEDLQRFDVDNNVLKGVVRTETLEDDLVRSLNEAGHVLSDEKLSYIYSRADKKLNTSKHGTTASYYDKDTIELVRLKERFIIEKYGYKPPALGPVEM